jgi:hypothetical protein
MTQLSAAKQAEPALAGQYEEEPQTGGRPADRAAAHVVVLVDEWARLHRRVRARWPAPVITNVHDQCRLFDPIDDEQGGRQPSRGGHQLPPGPPRPRGRPVRSDRQEMPTASWISPMAWSLPNR